MRIHNKEFELFLSEEEISKKVRHLAEQLNLALANKNPIFMIILNGAYLFGADLTRQFNGACEITFVKIKSYQGMSSAGVSEFSGFQNNINERHLVIIEDIVDSGKTLFHLQNELKEFKPASLTTVALLQKNLLRPNLMKADLVGFEIPDEFVVGYGLDYDEAGRNLKDVWKVRHSDPSN